MNIDRMNDKDKSEISLFHAGDVFLYCNNYYIVVALSDGTLEHAYFNLFNGERLYIPNCTRVVHCPIATVYPWGR